MRALVTGGAGFVGSNLVDALLLRGDQVTVLDDLSTGRRVNLETASEAGAELLVGDVTDPVAVHSAFEAAQPETVFHLAAQIDVRVSVSDPAFDARINVAGTLNVIEAARQTGGARVVFASTGGAIYGEGAGRELPLAEDAECLPDAPYGQAKLAAEGYVDLYRRLHGVPGISLRLGNVYGPRQDPLGEAGVIAIFCGRLASGQRPTVFGTGEQTRDYIYVGDVVAAFLRAAESEAGGAYNIGTGVETSVLELVERISDLADRPDFEPEMAPARPGEVDRISIDSARAGGELDWRAENSLDEGLRLTLAWQESQAPASNL
jgi:UDP-glucose 4-epimerase